MAKLSPVFNDQTIDANGDPYVGALLFTYTAGSSTKRAVYTDSAGLIPHSNPIIIDSLGFPEDGPIWLPDGALIKFVLAPPTDTDPPTSPIKTIDNVQGVNDSSASQSQWQATGVPPTYVSANSFTLVGDQTNAFQIGRRAQFTTSGGTVYGNITASVFGGSTTVTMQMDAGQVLDSGLSVVNLSLLLTSPSAEPSIKTQSFAMGSAYGNFSVIGAKGATVASAATTPIFGATDGNTVDISGSFNGVTSLGTSLTPGYTLRGTILGAVTFTPSANLVLNGGGGSITAIAGDTYVAWADTATLAKMVIIRASGAAATGNSNNATLKITATGAVLTSANAGNIIEVNAAGATTTALPALSTLPDGASITFSNVDVGVATFNRSVAPDTFYGGNLTTATSFSLNKGETATFSKCVPDNVWVQTGGNINFFGLPKTSQDLTASRAVGATYTNTTGRSIEISITGTMSAANGILRMFKAGIFIQDTQAYVNGARLFLTATILPGQTYGITHSAGTFTILGWTEDR